MRRANVGGWRRVAPSSALGTFSPDGEKGRSFWFWCYRDFAPTALGRAGETRFRFIIHSRKAGGIVGLEWRLAPGLAARCELGQLERRTKAEGGGRGLVDGWGDGRSTNVARWRSVAPSSALRAPSPPLANHYPHLLRLIQVFRSVNLGLLAVKRFLTDVLYENDCTSESQVG